jgi:alpha-mannosidase
MANIPDWARDDLKLRLVLPLNFPNPSFYSQGAFELREPYDRFFPILRYAGAEGKGRGVAIYTDRATSGIFDKENSSLSIALAYGGNFIYAPNNQSPLSGNEEYELALYFYQGDRERARVSQLADEIAQPVFAFPSEKDLRKDFFSILQIEPENAVVLSALYPTEKGFILRLWRPYEGEREVNVKLEGGEEVWLTDMRGNPQEKIGEKGTARIKMKKDEIVALLVSVK